MSAAHTSTNDAPTASSSFTRADDLSIWDLRAADWLQQHTGEERLDGLATSVAVFNEDSRVLLVQRAATDSMPNKWEPPGGAVDDDDESILHGAARELWEEAGLRVRHFTHLLAHDAAKPGHVFKNRAGTKQYCRFMFSVETVDHSAIKLDPNEHQAFFWASEAEVQDQHTEGRDLSITHESVAAMLLYAFQMRRQHATVQEFTTA